jgi:hypothetical protein
MGSIFEKNQRSTISCYCTFKHQFDLGQPPPLGGLVKEQAMFQSIGLVAYVLCHFVPYTGLTDDEFLGQ